MNRNDKEWQAYALSHWDEHVAANPGQGASLEESREAFIRAYVTAVTAGDTRWQVDVETEGRNLFARSVDKTRKTRRANLARDGEHLLAALNDETILGNADPLLDQALPIGAPDGRDKTLRFWTWEDWDTAKTERYRNAAETTAAAKDFDLKVASRFIAALRRPDVRRTEDLFRSDLDGDDESPLVAAG